MMGILFCEGKKILKKKILFFFLKKEVMQTLMQLAEKTDEKTHTAILL